MVGKPMDIYKVFQFYTKKVSVFDIKDFCEKNNFYVYIYDGGYIELRRYKDGLKQVL